ncbi:MAG: hypothetical protein AB1938_02740 [Myxococcota bacterium]
MADLPDVLDAMGKTPREFGTMHVHFEGYHVVDGNRCVASVLAQAAFVPSAGASLRLFDGEAELASALILPLDDGRVLRFRIPFRKQPATESLTLKVDAPEPSASAVRVRPVWKLLDTFEIPRLSEMNPVHADDDLLTLGGRAAVLALAGGLTGSLFLQAAGVGSAALEATPQTKVHRAQELPPLAGPRLEGVTRPIDGVEAEVVWTVGQAIPEAPPPVPQVKPAAPAQAGALRWCRTCGFEGPAAEYERARSCPRCDEPWF